MIIQELENDKTPMERQLRKEKQMRYSTTGLRAACGFATLLPACTLETDPGSTSEDLGAHQQELYGVGTMIDLTSTDGPVGAVGKVAGCSGTLAFAAGAPVPNQTILSAAHCFACTAGERATFTVTPTGNTYEGDVECSPLRNSAVDSFTAPGGAFDIAVITLDTPVATSDVLDPQPVFLGSQLGQIDNLFVPFTLVGLGKPCSVDGGCEGDGLRRWGQRDSGELWKDDCGDLFEGHCSNTRLWRLPELAFTTIASAVNPSKGDSGGPLYLQHQGVPKIVGVTSGGGDTFVGVSVDRFSIYAQTSPTFEQAEWLARALGAADDTTREELAVFATNDAWVNDRASVIPQTQARLPDVAGVTVNVGTDALVHDVFGSFIATMRNQAHSLGRVKGYHLNRQNGAQADLGFEPAPALLPESEAWFAFLDQLTFTGSGTLSLDPGQLPTTVPLAPGQHGSVSVKRGRTLQLEPGTYYFTSFDIGSQSSVLLTGGGEPTYIYVRDWLNIQGQVSNVQRPLFIGVVNQSNVAIDSTALIATIVAPRSSINLAPGKQLLGSLFGRSVYIHQDAVVRFVPFLFPWHQP